MIKKLLILCSLYALCPAQSSQNTQIKEEHALTPVTQIAAIQDIILGYLDKWIKTKGYDARASVYAVAISPCSKFLASVGALNSVKIVDFAPQTEKTIMTLAPVIKEDEYETEKRHYTSNTVSIAYSPCGKYIAIASEYGLVKIWELSSRECLQKIIYTVPVYSVAYSRDGQYLVTGASDGHLQVYQVNAGSCTPVAFLPLDKNSASASEVRTVAFSPCNKNVASGSKDGAIRIYDWATQTCIKTIKAHAYDINSIAYSPCGKKIAASAGHEIKIWNCLTGECVKTLIGHTDTIRSIVYSPCGTRIVSGSHDNTVKVWHLLSGSCFTYQSNNGGITCVANSACGKYIASGSWNGIVDVLKNQAIAIQHARESDLIDSSTIARDDIKKLLLQQRTPSSLLDAVIPIQPIQLIILDYLRNLPQESIYTQLCGHERPINNIACSADGKFVISVSDDSTAKVWHVASTKCIRTIFEDEEYYFCCAAFSPCGNYVALGSSDKTVKIYDIVSGRIVRTLIGHKAAIGAIAYSPCGSYIISGAREQATNSIHNKVKMWDVRTGECIKTCSEHTDAVTAVAYSSDGTYFATGSKDGTIKIWDTPTAVIKSRKTIYCSSPITTLVHAKSPLRIAYGTDSGTIAEIDVETEKMVNNLDKYTQAVSGIAYSPCERYLISAAGQNNSYGSAHITLSDLKTKNKNVQTFVAHDRLVTSLAYSSCGGYIASGSTDNTIAITKTQAYEIEHAK